ncbi:unnamed protein product [Prunus brigantina]
MRSKASPRTVRGAPAICRSVLRVPRVIGKRIRPPPTFGRGKVLQPNQAVPLGVVRCGGSCSSTSEYCEFLMGDTRASDRHARYHSETSTSGRGEGPTHPSPRQGVTVVTPGNPRIPIGKPIRHLFGVD